MSEPRRLHFCHSVLDRRPKKKAYRQKKTRAFLHQNEINNKAIWQAKQKSQVHKNKNNATSTTKKKTRIKINRIWEGMDFKSRRARNCALPFAAPPNFVPEDSSSMKAQKEEGAIFCTGKLCARVETHFWAKPIHSSTISAHCFGHAASKTAGFHHQACPIQASRRLIAQLGPLE